MSASKIDRIVMDCEMVDFCVLQRFREQVEVEFAEQDLSDILRGEVKCNQKLPEPVFGYALKYRQEELKTSDVARALFQSPVKASDAPVSPMSMTSRKKVELDQEGADIVIGCPDAEDCLLSPQPTVLVDESLYFARLEATRKESSKRFQLNRIHSERVTKAVNVLKNRCTSGLHETLQEEFYSRDVPTIVAAICAVCGPGVESTGLNELQAEWWNLQKIPTELITESVKRIEKLARDIAAYEGGQTFTDRQKLDALERILRWEANYEEFWWSVLDALKEQKATWVRTKARIQSVANQMADHKRSHTKKEQPKQVDLKPSDPGFMLSTEQKALLASQEMKKMLEVETAKAVEKIKKGDSTQTASAANSNKKPREEWLKTQKCHNCEQLGHLQKDCPKPKVEKSDEKKSDEKKSEVTAALVVGCDNEVQRGGDVEDEIDESHLWLCNPAEPLYTDTSALAVMLSQAPYMPSIQSASCVSDETAGESEVKAAEEPVSHHNTIHDEVNEDVAICLESIDVQTTDPAPEKINPEAMPYSVMGGNFNNEEEMHTGVHIHETDSKCMENLASDESPLVCACVQEHTARIDPESKGNLAVVPTSLQECIREVLQVVVILMLMVVPEVLVTVLLELATAVWCHCSQQMCDRAVWCVVADKPHVVVGQRQGGGGDVVQARAVPEDIVLPPIVEDLDVFEPPNRADTPSRATEVVQGKVVHGKDELGPLRKVFDPGGNWESTPYAPKLQSSKAYV